MGRFIKIDQKQLKSCFSTLILNILPLKPTRLQNLLGMESSDQELSVGPNLNFPGQSADELLFDEYRSLH